MSDRTDTIIGAVVGIPAILFAASFFLFLASACLAGAAWILRAAGLL